MAKLPEELGDGGLGDLTSVFHQNSVSDYRWLDVDPEEYRKFEALPKQNHDIIPELTEFLSHEPDERVPSLVIQRPITVVNSNPLDRPAPPARSSNIENLKSKIASMVMANASASKIHDQLLLEYSPNFIKSCASEIQKILEERGLLGNVYVNASHFSKCHQSRNASRAFVSQYAPNAKYVLAKKECSGCVCNRSGICGAFGKTIVDQVPYDRKLLAGYAPRLVQEKRISLKVLNSIPSDSDSIRGLLRNAFRTSAIHWNPEAPKTVHTYNKPVRATASDADVEKFVRERLSAQKTPLPAPAVLSALRSLTNGHSPMGLARSVDPSVRRIATEHGLIGHTYLDIDALGGPKATLGFIKTKNLNPEFLVGRQAYDMTDELTQLVRSFSIHPIRPALGIENFKTALLRAVERQSMDKATAEAAWAKVQTATSVDWDKVISQVNLYIPEVEERIAEYSGIAASAFYGDTSKDRLPASDIIPEEVRRTISHLMNQGLCGHRLRGIILSRYTKDDLSQVPEIGNSLAPLDGVQGFFHIDPTAYADYGRGCNVGSKTLKHSKAQYVLACDKCTGCRLQTAPGWCSKYAKKMVRTIPESAHREASRRLTLPVIHSDIPIENPVEKFELAAEIHVDMNGLVSKPLDVSISSNSLSD